MAKKPKGPEGDVAEMERPGDDVPAFLKADVSVKQAEKAPPLKLSQLDKALKEKAEREAMAAKAKADAIAAREAKAIAVTSLTDVVVPIGRSRKDKKRLTPAEIKARADEAEARSKAGGKEPAKVVAPEFGKLPADAGITKDSKRKPKEALRHHVTGKIARGEATAITEVKPKEKKAAKPRAPRADITAIEEAARKGRLPPIHHNIYTAPTHKGYVKRMRAAQAAAEKGDLKSLKAMRAEPFWARDSSSRIIIRRWMDHAIIALNARAKAK